MQNFDESWTDEKLYKKYGITDEEIAFIESMVRLMEQKWAMNFSDELTENTYFERW